MEVDDFFYKNTNNNNNNDFILSGKEDHYNGITIDFTKLPTDLLIFGQMLEESLKQWENEGKKGIWLRIPIDKAHLISPSVELGFDFHHAESGYVMLTKWLKHEEENKLPRYASHYVGIGAVVVNPDTHSILVVKEKNGPITNIWKLPGGMVEPKEELSEGAVREVKEETGIDTEFVTILCFRQHTTAAFGKSDLYFVALLRPLTFNIIKQENEIADCQWMKVIL